MKLYIPPLFLPSKRAISKSFYKAFNASVVLALTSSFPLSLLTGGLLKAERRGEKAKVKICEW
jgi:hypothetical protein